MLVGKDQHCDYFDMFLFDCVYMPHRRRVEKAAKLDRHAVKWVLSFERLKSVTFALQKC